MAHVAVHAMGPGDHYAAAPRWRPLAPSLALGTLGATCVLIILGGLVTNTGAALAVPDWPSTFGYNIVLFPWSRMVGGILYEHSHRLMGALVGVLTLALAGALLWEGGRLRWLGLIAVAVVVAQGVLGGLRVILLDDTLAIFHGCLAQAFFALLAVISLLTARRGRVATQPVEPPIKRVAAVAPGLVYVQIVFGALLTHAGRIDLHLAGAVLVFVLIPIVAALLRRTDDAIAVPVSRLVTIRLGVQLLLGIGSFLALLADLDAGRAAHGDRPAGRASTGRQPHSCRHGRPRGTSVEGRFARAAGPAWRWQYVIRTGAG